MTLLLPTAITSSKSERTGRPIRILHVIGHLHWGGTETWLMRVLRHIDRTRFQLDFLVHTTEPGAFDEEARALGARIIPCLHPSRPHAYARRFADILRAQGPYDVIHCHVHHFGGYIARLAYRLGIPARIVHSHCATTAVDQSAGLLRRFYLNRMQSWIERYATVGLAASGEAAAALYGSDWDKDARWKVLYCGIDLEPFGSMVDRRGMRAEFGIPSDAWVIGHVGTFGRPKNHAFLLRIAARLVREKPNVFVLLVGDGELRPAVEAEASRLGIAEQVLFCGSRGDVARLMLGMMDIFLFPSLWEGLPLALVEAQAAGLPCVVSDVVTKEADLVPQLITRLSLSAPISAWSDALVNHPSHGSTDRAAESRALVAKSPFNSDHSTRQLEALYADLAAGLPHGR